jgi:YVTN family beta-propeller protein
MRELFSRNPWYVLTVGCVALCIAVAFGAPVASGGSPSSLITPAGASVQGIALPTGKIITPNAAPGATFTPLSTGLRSDENADAGGAVATALSPDGETLLVLTSGYNGSLSDEDTGAEITFPVLDPLTGAPSGITSRKTEWIFVFDVSHHKKPVKKQQITLPNTFHGIAWAPGGERFYVSGGIDDRIYVFRREVDKPRQVDQFVPDAPFILLGHNSNQQAPLPNYDGGLLKGTAADRIKTGAVVAGLDVSKDGNTLVATNLENDSISIVDTRTRQVTKEMKFFEPGETVATGEYPFDVAIMSDEDTGVARKVFVSSLRDNEVLAVDLTTDAITRIAVGVLPTRLLLSRHQRQLYVTNSESDTISVISTSQERVVETLSLRRQGDPYTGAAPNSLALAPKRDRLYVTLGGENAVAVVDLDSRQVLGRIPTGWYPSSVSVSENGQTLYVVNAKGVAGPNPSGGRSTQAGQDRNTTFKNEYVLGLEKAGMSTIPVPSHHQLVALSEQVNLNNGFHRRGHFDDMMQFLEGKIQYAVYIIKENRTYDQVLGDLDRGNGDPDLTLFPELVSPNHHKLAQQFVTLDNFYVSGSVSGDGWGWSTFARTTDYTEKTVPVLYGNGFSGLSYDYEGNNRFVLVALPDTTANPTPTTARITSVLDPSGRSNILPGSRDVSAPAGSNDLAPQATGGYLWDAVLRAGKTVRAYGILADLSDFYYATVTPGHNPLQPDPGNPLYIPISPTPFADNIPQAPASKPSLEGRTDLYFRGYDQKQPELWSFNEWKRDLEAYVAEHGTMPNFMIMAFDHDHFGSFGQAVARINTPELQMADNDYALGLLVEYLSQRPEWKNTAIFVIEDDAQDGPDHVDAHRSVAYIISPYTRRGGAVVSTSYNTVNMLRTMEDLLGIDYLNVNDANALAMSDAFTRQPNFTPYTAILPGNLCKPPVDTELLGITAACQDPNRPQTAAVPLRHEATWWANATKDFNFEELDNVGDVEKFNRVLWAGIRGDHVPYPEQRTAVDLRQHRDQLLATWRQKTQAPAGEQQAN